MLNSKFSKLKHQFGIAKPEDWAAVDPLWILAVDGVGPVTLDYLRVLLAARGLTLRNDRTPEHWKKHLAHVRVLEELGDSEMNDDGSGGASDTAVICPFTILIDSAEQCPLTFEGLYTDADRGARPLIVHTEWRALGRGSESLGDYSIDGLVGRIHIERKSCSDLQSTVLGWGKNGEDGRRQRFERELQNLNEIEAGFVVVECSFGEWLKTAPSYGRKTAEENKKILFRSWRSWVLKYRNVQWCFFDDRRLAEVSTFRLLEKFWNEEVERAAGMIKAAAIVGATAAEVREPQLF